MVAMAHVMPVIRDIQLGLTGAHWNTLTHVRVVSEMGLIGWNRSGVAVPGGMSWSKMISLTLSFMAMR